MSNTCKCGNPANGVHLDRATNRYRPACIACVANSLGLELQVAGCSQKAFIETSEYDRNSEGERWDGLS
jgi:hypothetical protein